MVLPGARPAPLAPTGFVPSMPNAASLAPGVVRSPDFSGRMNLGGPTDDIDRSMRLDEGRPAGVRVAQAGGGSLMDIARQRAGVVSPDVPGIVTDAGRNRRMDVPATREFQGQQAVQAASPDQQERLTRLRAMQQRWTQTYGRPPRAGYYYGDDGREMPLTDKNFKGDREAQATAMLNFRKIEAATDKLLEYSLPGRAVRGTFNMGEVGQAYSDLEQGATGLAYALSGKQVAVAEMKSFINAYKPEPFDSEDRIKLKVSRMKSFYEALLTASRGGESYEQAFARAVATAGLKNPDGGTAGAPAAASAGQQQRQPQDSGGLRGLTTDELVRRLNNSGR